MLNCMHWGRQQRLVLGLLKTYRDKVWNKSNSKVWSQLLKLILSQLRLRAEREWNWLSTYNSLKKARLESIKNYMSEWLKWKSQSYTHIKFVYI